MSATGYVFLDFDGVLNDEETRRAASTPRFTRSFRPDGPIRVPVEPRDTDEFTPRCVHNLNLITLITGGEIVITTGRRYSQTFEALVDLLHRLNVRGAIAGQLSGQVSDDRGARIVSWLESFATPDVAFVVLDDEVHDMGPVSRHVIHVDGTVGLTAQDATRAISIFRGGI